jgi:hypothetical protein
MGMISFKHGVEPPRSDEPTARSRRVKKLSRTQSAAFHTIYGVPDWRRINRLRLRRFRFRKCKNLLLLTGCGVFFDLTGSGYSQQSSDE